MGYFDREVRKLRRGDDSDWCFWDHSLLELAGLTMGEFYVTAAHTDEDVDTTLDVIEGVLKEMKEEKALS